MHTFKDFYKNEVTFSYKNHPFSKNPRHVLVLCTYKNQWLLTKHKERGLEFPGGNVEKNETAEQGAVREVYEETGGKIKKLYYIGQYFVKGKKEHIIKNVYYGVVEYLSEQDHYYETLGPVTLKELPKNIKTNPSFSFLMKDKVLVYSLKRVREKFFKKDKGDV